MIEIVNMSSRARDTGRHYASGSTKHKAKDENEIKKQAVISKTRKLSEFFNVQSDGAESKEIEAENTEVVSHCVDDGSAIEESSLPLRSATLHDLATFSTSQTEVECIASPPNLAISSSSQREVKSTANPSHIVFKPKRGRKHSTCFRCSNIYKPKTK